MTMAKKRRKKKVVKLGTRFEFKSNGPFALPKVGETYGYIGRKKSAHKS